MVLFICKDNKKEREYMSLLTKIFGDPNVKEIKKLEPVVALINNLEKDYEKLTTENLQLKTKEFKEWIKKGETLDNILPEAFAAVRETAKRKLGQRHYDVQLMAGIVLHQGKIAEMKTGEGKTLVATLPLYLNALAGKGCHIVTPNDYLSRVGGGWMGPIYHALGISVGVICHEFSARFNPNYKNPDDQGDERLNHWEPCSRAEAYKADITYGTNNEFGFDYLRDNMAVQLEQLVQRELHYAIVDEVDSILIDEARTPLIISAPAEESANLYQRFAQLIPQLKKEKDYEVDEKERAVSLTQDGIKKMEKLLGVANIYERQGVQMAYHLEEALKAHILFKRDKEYVVKEGEIIIVDEFTGRLMPGRRYSGGLHQAIEAKERVEVKRESDTLATISFQNLFRMYEKLAGMTGTAATEAEEFYKIYKLEVMEIPTNRPMIRENFEDEIYKIESAKYQAIIGKVKELNRRGQPILIGTISIEKNEYLSKLLKRNGIKHNLLNAKHHEQEAKIIAQAGKIGAVTVATNMAGRGVDIVLGGEPPKIAISDKRLANSKIKDWEKEHQKVLELDGLFILGTERHESRRIDNQLRGRAGRQGDPGISQFYVSMEDDLMRIFGGEKMKNMMDRLGLPDDQPIKHKMISGSIEQAQKKVEGHNFDIRKHLVDYDDVMNKHREVLYRKRRKVLVMDPQKEDWLHREIKELMDEKERKDYQTKISGMDLVGARQMEKIIYLRTIDVLWVEHLNTMTELREGIGLRGYGQRDPLVEYKQQSYGLFQKLISDIENKVIEVLTKIQIQQQATGNMQQVTQNRANLQMQGADENLAGGGIQQPQATNIQSTNVKDRKPKEQTIQTKSGVSVIVRENTSDDTVGGATSDGESLYDRAKNAGGQTQTIHRTIPKVGRNEKCPCGSGKKYKKCHGR